MVAKRFDALSWAQTYADRHLQTDPGIRAVFFLPDGAAEREIRLIEVNELAAIADYEMSEPIEFGVDRGNENEHSVQILDVSPAQWDTINQNPDRLPQGWSLKDYKPFSRN